YSRLRCKSISVLASLRVSCKGLKPSLSGFSRNGVAREIAPKKYDLAATLEYRGDSHDPSDAREEKTMTYNHQLATLGTFLLFVVSAALMPTRALAACDATTIAGNYGYRLNGLFAPTMPAPAFFPIGSFTPIAVAGRIV